MATVNTDPLASYPVETIERSGRALYRPFRHWVEVDDCRQEAWVCYFANREEFDQKISEGETWYVAKAIRNWVGEYCRRIKAIACGYRTDDEQFYGQRKTRVLLEYFLAGEQPPSSTEGRQGTVSVGTESHAELLDIERAWKRLDQGTRDVLWAAYGPDGHTPETYDATERARTRRALGRLLDLLNGTA